MMTSIYDVGHIGIKRIDAYSDVIYCVSCWMLGCDGNYSCLQTTCKKQELAKTRSTLLEKRSMAIKNRLNIKWPLLKLRFLAMRLMLPLDCFYANSSLAITHQLLFSVVAFDPF